MYSDLLNRFIDNPAPHFIILVIFIFLIYLLFLISKLIILRIKNKHFSDPDIIPWVSARIAREKFTCKTYKREVNTNEAYIYEKMSVKSSLIGKFNFKEKVCISESKNEWFKTRYGWVLTSNFK